MKSGVKVKNASNEESLKNLQKIGYKEDIDYWNADNAVSPNRVNVIAV